jgi:NADPH:quinone reductase-like Zn-dependent oxidoreductase
VASTVEPPKLPAGVGYEAAGVVEAVGPDVDKNWVGKRVAIIPAFSMNDYAMLGEEVIAPAALWVSILRSCPRRKAQRSGCSI